MKTKFVLASLVAALSGLAAIATPASAAPDVHVRVNLGTPRPPVVVVVDHGRDNDRNRGGREQIVFNREEPRSGVYGSDWYAKQRELKHRANPSVPQGFWKEVVVRDVIPGHWEVVGYDHRGRAIQNFQPTRVVFRTERVWVDGRR